jgi:ribosomal protein S6--L-glutamate ligase
MRIAILSRKSRLFSNREFRRAAVARGHSVTALDPVNLHFSLGNGNAAIFNRSRRLKAFDALIPRIQPNDAYGLASIEHFNLTGCFVLNESRAVASAHDKATSLQILCQAGVAVPPTVLLKHPLSVHSAIKEIGGLPVVFKPLMGAQGMGVILVESESDADSLVGLGWEWNQPCMLQKFYPEAAGEDYRFIVIGGNVVAAMKRKAKKGDWRSNFHRGGKGYAHSPTKAEERLVKKAAKAIGLNFCGVDMLKTDDGPVIVEVNASPGLKLISSTTGVDVAGELMGFIEGIVGRRK